MEVTDKSLAYHKLYGALAISGRNVDRLQQQADRTFTAMSRGFLTEDEFKALLNRLYFLLPDGYDKNNLRGRMNRNRDGSDRDLGTFALEMWRGHRQEQEAARDWRAVMLAGGRFTALELLDNGADNSGRLLLRRRDVSQAADYRVRAAGGTLIPDGEHPLEAKVNTKGIRKATYKLHNLRAYRDQGSYVLTVWHDGPDRYWGLFGPAEIDRMLADFPLNAYGELGGHVGIQLLRNDFEKYLNFEKLLLPG